MSDPSLPPLSVVVLRGDVVESRHAVHVVVTEVDEGTPVAWAGDPDLVTFYRSAAKPFQALPLVEDGVVDALGLSREELALCCGSHSGEPRHVEVARSILHKADVVEEALACGPHLPLGEEAGRALLHGGGQPGRIHNNCSGKHAGMLALAARHGWALDGYHEADHPVQQRMLREVAGWSGVPPSEMATAVDGCGVVCFAVPLRDMAGAYARLARSVAAGSAAPEAVVGAMTEHPWMVAGTGRLCTVLMEAAGGRIFAKTGAEGVYCAGVPALGLGVALKALDGGRRAAEAALVAVLDGLDLLDGVAGDGLERFRRPPVRNTRGEAVGEVRVEGELTRRSVP